MTVPFSEVSAEGSNLSISPDEPKQQEKSSAITLFTAIVQTSKQIEDSCVKMTCASACLLAYLKGLPYYKSYHD